MSRVWLREHLPSPLAALVPKRRRCRRDEQHEFYNAGNGWRACYHCRYRYASEVTVQVFPRGDYR